MSQVKKDNKVNKESFLGYVATIIAIVFIIGFPFFAHYQNKTIIKNNINEALKKEGIEMSSYTFEHRSYDYQNTKDLLPIKANHSSLYNAFYNMFEFKTEFGNNKIYEVKGNNEEKYEMNINRKLQVVEWHKL